ncbi:splicing factor 3A subunit 1-like [Oppia nitens]|uniref:splicing factor 3A subunit 1-like n=1 Tax=Oppia nitens TaxID=1686743 RepID=UPI0023DBF635|nr:splicing factor 3A subunit 1-like [Oppia nitens]
MSGETVGIIYPPPELRNIVDKTASFVARNGPEFESRIQQNEQNNPKFNFLKPGDPYNAYYQHKCKEFREGGKSGSDIVAAPTGPYNTTTTSTAAIKQSTQQTTVPKTAKQLELLMDTPIIPREPPPDFEFMEDPPSISALDLDIVKLTAQFVAIHGRSFLTNLMNREQRNYQFDFLRPQHGLFSYFTQLIEQYAKIHAPSKNVVDILSKELTNSKIILDKVRYRVEWTKVQEAEKRREEEEAEKERIQYAQIDWHDFVIVENVDYQPHEQGLFPPPTTPERVGSRILLQQRIEEQGQEAVEMDVDSDEENNDNKEEPNANKDKESMPPPPLPPLPPQLDNVLIRKDYNPKQTKPQLTQNPTPSRTSDSFVISPITGEKIPADKLQEHMRFGLLDPRWVEQRDRSIQEKMSQEEVYAYGSAIESSLKQLAERRTDIFGSGDEETVIGKKIGEEEHKKSDKGPIVWDGHTASVEAATRAARANITIEEQIQQIHKIKGLLPEDDKDKIGPALPSTSNSAIISAPPVASNPMISAPPRTQLISQPPVSIVTTSINVAQSLMPPPQPMQAMQSMVPQHPQMLSQMMLGGQPTPQHYMMAPHGLHMPHMGLYGMPMGPPPDMNMTPLGVPPPNMSMQFTSEEEPSSKKQRTEDNLIPEEEFVANNGPNVTIKIQVPQSSEKPEWNLTGQLLTFTLPMTDTLSVVKSKIHESTNMPPAKQKLQYEGTFVKDSNSLAYYNIPNGASIVLGLKERGGRKK